METTTPRGSARVLDPGLSIAKEAAKAVPPGKRSWQWKSTFIVFTLSRLPSLMGQSAFIILSSGLMTPMNQREECVSTRTSLAIAEDLI